MCQSSLMIPQYELYEMVFRKPTDPKKLLPVTYTPIFYLQLVQSFRVFTLSIK